MLLHINNLMAKIKQKQIEQEVYHRSLKINRERASIREDDRHQWRTGGLLEKAGGIGNRNLICR